MLTVSIKASLSQRLTNTEHKSSFSHWPSVKIHSPQGPALLQSPCSCYWQMNRRCQDGQSRKNRRCHLHLRARPPCLPWPCRQQQNGHNVRRTKQKIIWQKAETNGFRGYYAPIFIEFQVSALKTFNEYVYMFNCSSCETSQIKC